MFNDIGGKIKTLATVTCWIGIIGSVIYGIVLTIEADPLAGIGLMVIGALISWISCFVLYGYGELIDNTDATQYDTREMIAKLNMYLPRITIATEKIAGIQPAPMNPTVARPKAAPPMMNPAANPAPFTASETAAPAAPHRAAKTCASCGRTCEVNLDTPNNYCPYCGNSL